MASNHPTDGASIFSYALTAAGMPDPTTALEWVSHTKGGGTQSTPVVHNGRLYIGGGGYTMGSAEPFHVIDAETMKEIYSVPILTKGSAGISTAYATDENGQMIYPVSYTHLMAEMIERVIQKRSQLAHRDIFIRVGVNIGKDLLHIVAALHDNLLRVL